MTPSRSLCVLSPTRALSIRTIQDRQWFAPNVNFRGGFLIWKPEARRGKCRSDIAERGSVAHKLMQTQEKAMLAPPMPRHADLESLASVQPSYAVDILPNDLRDGRD